MLRRLAPVLVLLLGVALAASAQSFTLNVVDQSERRTRRAVPLAAAGGHHLRHRAGDPASGSGPVARVPQELFAPCGHGGLSQQSAVITVPDPAKRYFVSVLPAAGYTMSGARSRPTCRRAPAVTVKVHQHPIPTAQISVRVFHDNAPINDIEDQPNEVGLAGFKITLEDAGGRYGISAGAMMMDAFGNPLGTTYDADGNIVKMGSGVVTTDANGDALIQNLAPGKYGVSVVPPRGRTGSRPPPSRAPRSTTPGSRPDEPPVLRGVRPARGARLLRLRAAHRRTRPSSPAPPAITGQVVWACTTPGRRTSPSGRAPRFPEPGWG